MLIALVITNCILNVLFAVVCGLVAYGVIKNRDKTKPSNTTNYRRKN